MGLELAMKFNWSPDTDPQRQEASSRRMLPSGQLRRYTVAR